MGEAKNNRKRLGLWYGKPIVPGHPDYIAPTESQIAEEAARIKNNHRTIHPILAMALALSAGIDGFSSFPNSKKRIR